MTALDMLLSKPADAVRHLLPDIEHRRKSATEARAVIEGNPDLLPLALATDNEGKPQVFWVELSRHDSQEWQQVFSLAAAVRSGSVGESFVTGLDVLAAGPPADAASPTGFVFHMSRCGSTLVSRALARSPRALVHSQPGVLREGIWSVLTDEWTRMPSPTPERLALFRSVVGHLFRSRPGQVDAFFLKFFSENVLFLDFIRAAFPDTPCLFLFRDPVEVIASVDSTSTGMLAARGTLRAQLVAGVSGRAEARLNDHEFIVGCYRRYFDVVLSADRVGLTLLDYRDLTRQQFEPILSDAFGYQLPHADRAAVLEQFGLHSKSDSAAPVPFADDSATKKQAVSSEHRALVENELGSSVDLLRELAWTPPRSGTGANR